TLFPDYRHRNRGFFAVGRVCAVLWAEPAPVSAGIAIDRSLVSSTYHGERIFSKVRRFVIVASYESHSIALPIVSYGRQGASKRGVNPKHHAVIYTGKNEPLPFAMEHGLLRPGIRAVPDNPLDTLDSASRINFSKVYTIEHNVKVKSVGVI
ncbi:uncharacterized protein MYCGRDRAFT_27543, partial [Zymoseptoria tritici IPO323]